MNPQSDQIFRIRRQDEALRRCQETLEKVFAQRERIFIDHRELSRLVHFDSDHERNRIMDQFVTTLKDLAFDLRSAADNIAKVINYDEMPANYK